MGWKHRGTRDPIALSTVLAISVAGWICSPGTTSQAMAQEPRVTIEPRAPHVGATGEADRASGRIRVDSNLVLIPVMVTDGQDRLITGLAREHFRLWDGKTEQVISHFAQDDAPVSISFVFDSSGSMSNKLKKSRAALTEFIRAANPQDEFSLVQFNDNARLLQPFTDRTEDILNRMLFVQSKGRTALLDGVLLAMNEMRHAKHSRKAILIISDGGDNHSRYSLHEIQVRLREADVQVYSIGVMDPPGFRTGSMEERDGASILDGIAKQTGGRLFEIDDLNLLPDVAAKIGSALRNQYLLGYVPADGSRDGKFHRVRVKIAAPKGMPPLRASFRAGYFAPEN